MLVICAIFKCKNKIIKFNKPYCKMKNRFLDSHFWLCETINTIKKNVV